MNSSVETDTIEGGGESCVEQQKNATNTLNDEAIEVEVKSDILPVEMKIEVCRIDDTQKLGDGEGGESRNNKFKSVEDLSPSIKEDSKMPMVRVEDIKKDEVSEILMDGVEGTKKEEDSNDSPGGDVETNPVDHNVSSSSKPNETDEQGGNNNNVKVGGKRKKRRHSSVSDHHQTKKIKDKNFLPNKFLCGGNITDPLNLKELDKDKKDSFATPVRPVAVKDVRLPLCIPAEMTDPLRLFTQGPIHKSSGRRRNKKKNGGNAKAGTDQSNAQTKGVVTTKVNTSINVKDPIVSPAIKQDYSASQLPLTKAARRRTLSLRLDINEPKSKRGKKKQQQQQGGGTSGEQNDGKSQKKENKQSRMIDQGSARTAEEVEAMVKNVKFKEREASFQYGNYSRYYGYRCNNKFNDPRLNCLSREWFKDKDVLDVGCNSGQLTLLIAREFSPRKIVGVDIDENLIKAARANVRHYASSSKRPDSRIMTYPSSFSSQYGSVTGPPLETGSGDSANFPNNVNFHQGNYVPESPLALDVQEPEYDVIMCLSVTKWLHLNFGDEGLKKTFKRMFKQLRPGGKLIIEPQPWKSYHKKKKICETVYRNYLSITMRPEHFTTYLVDEIGFTDAVALKYGDKQAGGGRSDVSAHVIDSLTSVTAGASREIVAVRHITALLSPKKKVIISQ